ncbi:hypothetical protein [Haliea sp. E17]|uniref:hypothetical protein n=1 Tax=Haliea sp. E17 TaxID=3401576 RepID=UPI003AAD9825
MENDDHSSDSLLESLRRLTGQVAGSTFELARTTATMTAMFGETWLRATVLNHFEPERMEAMREAGNVLRDARETAGLSIRELAESLGLKDKQVLEDVEHGKIIMPLELMLRSASLLARHDPIPFLIKFMRTYNPALEKTLEQLGVMALPRQYERERRFVNLYRQHDVLRGLSDAEFERFIDYMTHSGELVVEMMQREKAARTVAPEPKAEAASKPAASRARAKTSAASKNRSGAASKPAKPRAARPRKTSSSSTKKA